MNTDDTPDTSGWTALVPNLHRIYLTIPTPKDDWAASLKALHAVWLKLAPIRPEVPPRPSDATYSEAQLVALENDFGQIIGPMIEQMVRERFVLFTDLALATFMAGHYKRRGRR